MGLGADIKPPKHLMQWLVEQYADEDEGLGPEVVMPKPKYSAGWLEQAVTKNLIAKGVFPPGVTTLFDVTADSDVQPGDFLSVSPSGGLQKAKPGDVPALVVSGVSPNAMTVEALEIGAYPPVGLFKKPKKVADKDWLSPEQLRGITQSHKP